MANKYTAPWEWHFTKFVIAEEVGREISQGNLSYDLSISIVDDVVNITDSAILKAYHESKL